MIYQLSLWAWLVEPALGGKEQPTFGCFGSEAVTHSARDRVVSGSNLPGDMLEFCDLI